METLEILFGGKVRIRLIRQFLLNPDKIYDAKTAAVVCRGKVREVSHELVALAKAGLIKRKFYFKELGDKRVRTIGWTLNGSFLFLTQLRNLLANNILLRVHDIAKRLSRGGTLKLVVLAGVFLQQWEARVDLLVVGEKLKKGILERIIASLESEIGRELHYVLLERVEFEYRLNVSDRLVRDIFDYPHHFLLNKFGIKA